MLGIGKEIPLSALRRVIRTFLFMNLNHDDNEGDSKMALFERNYRAAATSELERSIRDLEERDKKAQTKPAFEKDVADIHSNLNFVERINLISATQAEAFRQRVLKAHLDFKHMQRTETRDDIVDSFENPRERTKRYQDMESYNAQITQNRIKASTDSNDSEQSHTVRNELYKEKKKDI